VKVNWSGEKITNGLYGRCIHDLNPTDCKWCKENQKLRELMEKRLKECQDVYNDNTNSASHREDALTMGTTIQGLLDACKK